MKFPTIVEFMVECEKLLLMEDDEHAAELWENLCPPDGWTQFPQALKLNNRCGERYAGICYANAMAEDAIRNAEWKLRNPEK